MTSQVTRHQHFIPQSWIKRFKDQNEKLWAFDRETGEVKSRSSRKIMQIFNLYTIDPDGVDDTSLEAVELGDVDNEAGPLMTRILGGASSQDAKEAFARFLAAQLLRDPTPIVSYGSAAAAFALKLLVEVLTSSRFEDMDPGFKLTQAEYDHIHSLGAAGAGKALAPIIQIALRSNGAAELPFTDLLKSPDGRSILEQQLKTMCWTIIDCPDHSLILGDTGVLFDAGDLAKGMRVPLSHSAALLIEPKPVTAGIERRKALAHEADALNGESAARSRRWMVGAESVVRAFKNQVTGPALPQHGVGFGPSG